GFSWYVPVARGEVSDVRPAPHDSSSRPALFLSAMHGRKSAGDLRRKLRHRAGEKGRWWLTAIGANSVCLPNSARRRAGKFVTSRNRMGYPQISLLEVSMKRSLLILAACLVFTANGTAQ